MAIFRRSRDPQPVAIPQFWEWWSTVRTRFEAALPQLLPNGPSGPGGPDGPDGPDENAELVEQLSTHVAAVHPDLVWEFGAGPSLTLSGAGAGMLRGITERWRVAAPADGWDYRAARQADPEALAGKLKVDEDEFDLEYVRFGLRADTGRARVHITAYHPDFLFVSEETQAVVAGRILDWALGEDDVARWVGDVMTVTEPPVDSLPPTMLPAVVDQIAVREPVWLSGEGRTPLGHTARVVVRFPLHRQDHPLCDLHATVTLPYAHANPDRLPVEPSASALRIFEDALTALAPGVVIAAHETGDGKRVFHVYADPESGAVAELDQLAADWSEGRAKVVSRPDPAWQALAAYQP